MLKFHNIKWANIAIKLILINKKNVIRWQHRHGGLRELGWFRIFAKKNGWINYAGIITLIRNFEVSRTKK